MRMEVSDGPSSFDFIAAKRELSNLQMFTPALGGIKAAPITVSSDSQRPYQVMNDTFPDFATAAGRSCDVQHNSCCDAANAQKGESFSVSDCDGQQSKWEICLPECVITDLEAQCNTAQKNAAVQSFHLQDVGPDPNDPDFELYCEP